MPYIIHFSNCASRKAVWSTYMKTSLWWTIILVLFGIIGIMAWLLFTTPAPTGTVTGTATTTTAEVNEPLSTRVEVSAPKPNASVTKTFKVAGSAPGPWYFEASFPIKVIDKDGTMIGTSHGEAQGDWMTTGIVAFSANVTTSGYSGPATLVLLRDNPSGLPENDDAVSIPITIQ